MVRSLGTQSCSSPLVMSAHRRGHPSPFPRSQVLLAAADAVAQHGAANGWPVQLANVPVYLGATAGMRSLDDTERDAVMRARWLVARTPPARTGSYHFLSARVTRWQSCVAGSDGDGRVGKSRVLQAFAGVRGVGRGSADCEYLRGGRVSDGGAADLGRGPFQGGLG